MFSDSLLEFKILRVEDGQVDGFYQLKGIWYKYYSQGYISKWVMNRTRVYRDWVKKETFRGWDEVNTKTKAEQVWIKESDNAWDAWNVEHVNYRHS